jgi:hypothetical protein
MQKDGKAAAAVSAETRRLMKKLETYIHDPTKVRSTANVGQNILDIMILVL